MKRAQNILEESGDKHSLLDYMLQSYGYLLKQGIDAICKI